MRVGLVAALFSVLGLPFAAQQAGPAAAAALAPQPGVTVAARLRSSLAALGEAMAELDPDQLHVPDAEKRALADSQTSIRRNLRDAVPGLLAGFAAAPDNVGAAFLLYRDVNAVLTVAQRSAEMLPRRDADAAQPVESTADALSRDLDQLGNMIEARGEADYARRRPLGARPPGPALAPKTLVIGDANGAKPTAKKIPH